MRGFKKKKLAINFMLTILSSYTVYLLKNESHKEIFKMHLYVGGKSINIDEKWNFYHQ